LPSLSIPSMSRATGSGLLTGPGAPKVSGTYMHNFTTPLKDTGANAGTFTPGSLNFSLSGLPATAKYLLFQKSNGNYEIVLWNNVTNWNFSAGTPIPISPTNVGITFGSTQGVLNVYDPVVSSTPILTVSTTNTVTVALKDYPMIVEVEMMAMTITNNPAASGSAFTLDMGKDSVTGNQVQKVALTEPAGGTFITPMQQTGGSVTSLSSGAITNPTALFTRPSSAVTASVTQTIASPSVFTWAGNPLVNGQTVILGGTPASGFSRGVPYYVVAVAGNTFQLAATFGGAAIAGTGSSSAVTATLVYSPGALIASSATSPVVPSFAIATSAGGVILPRVRVLTNATSGWGGANLSVNLWSAAPTYATGDGGPYAPSGAANWLANFLVSLTQFGDGAAGGGGLTSANEMALKLASGTSIFADIQILSVANPIVGQTFTLVPELLN
jgi:hypothetical protein